MSTIEQSTTAVAAAVPRRSRGIAFWIARYVPAEISGTAAMIIAGLAMTAWTQNPALIAAAALVGEIIGFYVVLAIVIVLEQMRLGFGFRRAATRTGLLLVAEFGAAELLDTFLVRPVALLAGVALLQDPFWGLLVGKIVADVVFYAVAAGAFTITDKSGLRRRGATERAA